MQVEITADAELDLWELARYVMEHDSLAKAEKLLAGLRTKIFQIPSAVQAGRIVDEIEPFGLYEYRQILHKPYWIFYHFDDQTVWIDAVIDSRRRIEDQLYQRFGR